MAAFEHTPERQASLAALRARITRLERGETAHAAGVVPLCEPIDRTLPGGGLARAAIHEVLVADQGAAAAFCALILARLQGTVVWIGADRTFGPVA